MLFPSLGLSYGPTSPNKLYSCTAELGYQLVNDKGRLGGLTEEYRGGQNNVLCNRKSMLWLSGCLRLAGILCCYLCLCVIFLTVTLMDVSYMCVANLSVTHCQFYIGSMALYGSSVLKQHNVLFCFPPEK